VRHIGEHQGLPACRECCAVVGAAVDLPGFDSVMKLECIYA
jgi:hypothetical protein